MSAGVRKPPDLGGNQSVGVYCDRSLRPPFDPIRSNLAGLLEFLAVGCGLNEMAPSANSSRTSHLSPDGGGVTRAAVHRLAADGYGLAADGYGSQRMDRFGEVFLKYIAKSCFRTLDLARYLQ